MYSSFHVPPAWRHTASKIIVIGSKTCQNCLRIRLLYIQRDDNQKLFQNAKDKTTFISFPRFEEGDARSKQQKGKGNTFIIGNKIWIPIQQQQYNGNAMAGRAALWGVPGLLLLAQDDLDQSHKCCRGSTLCMGICTSNKLQFLLLVTLIISVFKMWI